MVPRCDKPAANQENPMTITRFAPSPTGYIHVGNLRTALMNYLIARKNGGEFILRIDDTDPVRSKEEYVDGLKEDLTWLGLHWDRVERQSERLDKYHAAADELRKIGRFYEAWETPTELDLKRKKQLNMGKPPVYDCRTRKKPSCATNAAPVCGVSSWIRNGSSGKTVSWAISRSMRHRSPTPC